MRMELKVYVWNRFCPDYSYGFAVAIAYTEEAAIEIIKDKYPWLDEEGFGPVEVYPLQEMAFAVSGGS